MRPLLLAAALTVTALAWLPVRPRPTHPRRAGRPDPIGPTDPAALLDLLDIALAAGASVPGALTAVADALAPADPAARLRAAGTALQLGAGWEEAWARCGDVLLPVADVLGPAWTDGVDPAAVVRHRAAAIRARRARESREAAARLGARLVLPLGLCFLPAFVLLSMVPVLLSGAGALLAP